MAENIFIIIGLLLTIILLALYCHHLNSKIEVMKMFIETHDKQITDLYIRKANREPMVPKRYNFKGWSQED